MTNFKVSVVENSTKKVIDVKMFPTKRAVESFEIYFLSKCDFLAFHYDIEEVA